VCRRTLARAREIDRKRLAKAVDDFDSGRVRNLLAPVHAGDGGRAAA
jgi:hypothetical protein